MIHFSFKFIFFVKECEIIIVASVTSISICIHFEGPILRIIDFGKLLPVLKI